MNTKTRIFLPILLLLTIGLIFISIASLNEASTTIGDKFFFIKKQLVWLVISYISYLVAKNINIKTLKKYIPFMYFFGLFLLLIVLTPAFGTETLGARRWLNLGIIGIQPSEIFKLIIIMFLALNFSNHQANILDLLKYLIPPFLLIILEPNLSTAILIAAISISLFYLANGNINSILILCLAGLLVFFTLIFISPYRFARFKTFLNREENTASTSYHSNQLIMTIASGGLLGKGFANSDQKYRFLPKISTDSILAVIGEETGFVGLSVIFILYIIIISSLIKFSTIIPDQFSSLLVTGITCWLSYQTLINTSAIVALIPLTGVPLPFISYGGSALTSLSFAVGLIKNIDINNQKLIYSTNDKAHSNKRHPSYPRSRTNLTTKK